MLRPSCRLSTTSTLRSPPSVLRKTSPSVTGAAASHANAAQDQRIAQAVSLKHAEVILIENSLVNFNGNISKAAVALGISRPTLYRKIQTLGIRSAATKA